MNLVLYGKHSIEKLEQWAVTLFSDVIDKNVVVPDLSQPVVPFDRTNLGKTIRFRPVKDEDGL